MGRGEVGTGRDRREKKGRQGWKGRAGEGKREGREREREKGRERETDVAYREISCELWTVCKEVN